MRRGLLLLASLGLFGLFGCGCHKCQGVCDCQVYPIEHGTPSPIVKPACADTIQPVPVQAQ
jgi:hypothetical protein